MRTRIFLFVALIAMSAHSIAQESRAEIIQKFLDGIIELDESINTHPQPVAAISDLAIKQATKIIEITKDEISSALKEARNFKNSIMITGNHTIVKITNHENCTQSGAWGVCMPEGIGYVQRDGELNRMEGFINNIIGIPDNQKRTLYLFD